MRAAPEAKPVSEPVTKDESACGEGAGNTGLDEPCTIVPAELPSLPEAPEAVGEPEDDQEYDGEDEEAVGGVVQFFSGGFPAGECEPEEAEEAARGEPGDRVEQSVWDPEIGESCAGEEQANGKQKCDEVESCQPWPGDTARRSGTVPLHEAEGHQQDDQKRRKQREHE